MANFIKQVTGKSVKTAAFAYYKLPKVRYLEATRTYWLSSSREELRDG